MKRSEMEQIWRCPLCNGEHTHINSVAMATAANHLERISVRGEDEHASITRSFGKTKYPHRRHTISLLLSCEGCGEFSTISFTQHKGNTYFDVNNSKDDKLFTKAQKTIESM
jgi:hypothetical protein